MSFEGKIRPDHTGRQNEGKLRAETESRCHATRRGKDDAEKGIVPENTDAVDGFNPFILIGNRFGKLDRDPCEDLVGGNGKK